jgi:putative transposase
MQHEVAAHARVKRANHTVGGAVTAQAAPTELEVWFTENRILLENYYLPGDLENQIEAFVAATTTAAITRALLTYPRPTSISDAARQSCCREKGSNARLSLNAGCSTNGMPA